MHVGQHVVWRMVSSSENKVAGNNSRNNDQLRLITIHSTRYNPLSDMTDTANQRFCHPSHIRRSFGDSENDTARRALDHRTTQGRDKLIFASSSTLHGSRSTTHNMKPNNLQRCLLLLAVLTAPLSAFVISSHSAQMHRSMALAATEEKAAALVSGEELEMILTEWDTPLVVDAYATW
jgi:hypothetical protein